MASALQLVRSQGETVMNIKALITTALVLGTSSLALAQPAPQGGVDVRDHRYYSPITQPA